MATRHAETASLDWTLGSVARIRLRYRRPYHCAGLERQAFGLLGSAELFGTAYRPAGHSCHPFQRIDWLCLRFGYSRLLVVKRTCWQFAPEAPRLSVPW